VPKSRRTSHQWRNYECHCSACVPFIADQLIRSLFCFCDCGAGMQMWSQLSCVCVAWSQIINHWLITVPSEVTGQASSGGCTKLMFVMHDEPALNESITKGDLLCVIPRLLISLLGSHGQWGGAAAPSRLWIWVVLWLLMGCRVFSVFKFPTLANYGNTKFEMFPLVYIVGIDWTQELLINAYCCYHSVIGYRHYLRWFL